MDEKQRRGKRQKNDDFDRTKNVDLESEQKKRRRRKRRKKMPKETKTMIAKATKNDDV